MAKLFIPIIAGTTRPKRVSIHAAEFIYEVASQIPDVESQLLDPNDFHIPFDGNDPECKDPHYTEITARADAFMIVSPEYNHSFPGSLKKLLDSELENYNHKPVAFAGVSNGNWGGVRAIEALVTTTREMGLVSSAVDLQFAYDEKLFVDGKIIEAEKQKYVDRVLRVYKELIWFANTLKYGRENITK
ncbi:NAD(P)H-dependent oxidoreductase [soil metagenome]